MGNRANSLLIAGLSHAVAAFANDQPISDVRIMDQMIIKLRRDIGPAGAER